MNTDICTGHSAIHESGVFARRLFQKGEVVLRWDISQVLPESTVLLLPEDEKKYISLFNGLFICMQEPER